MSLLPQFFCQSNETPIKKKEEKGTSCAEIALLVPYYFL
jgi:hypothetical protein